MAKLLRNPGPMAERLRQATAELQRKTVKVGWFESAKYEDGTSVAYVASLNELGKNARPFMRPTIADRAQVWKSVGKKGAKQVINGEATAGYMFELIGLQASGDIAKTITKITDPPLSPVTLLLRKRKKAGDKITGKTVGEAHREVNFVGPRRKSDKTLDFSGVSTKPLVDTGIMLNTLTYVVEDK
ncbi:hypothetical protein UZS93_14145 [Escherichia coli]|nr:hypothetical protein [Escherichia coli]MDY8957991.1 hypothetical protein [Escherichia coli]MDY8997152.1 hypothetical protein [Escherichia coli]MDY9034199.1 hypothetical protein [Escherichia coli]